jgi:hypothetical protein
MRIAMANQVKKELDSLAAETLALTAIIGFVFRRLGDGDPNLAVAIASGFDDAANFVEHVAIKAGKAASPDHTVKALRVVEEIRAAAVGNHGKPKHGV